MQNSPQVSKTGMTSHVDRQINAISIHIILQFQAPTGTKQKSER